MGRPLNIILKHAAWKMTKDKCRPIDWMAGITILHEIQDINKEIIVVPVVKKKKKNWNSKITQPSYRTRHTLSTLRPPKTAWQVHASVTHESRRRRRKTCRLDRNDTTVKSSRRRETLWFNLPCGDVRTWLYRVSLLMMVLRYSFLCFAYRGEFLSAYVTMYSSWFSYDCHVVKWILNYTAFVVRCSNFFFLFRITNILHLHSQYYTIHLQITTSLCYTKH